MILGKDVVLASGSPRRQYLLLELVEDFEILVPEIDEDALTVADPVETAELLAKTKALAALKQRPDGFIVAGDTVVALSEEDGTFLQLTKPSSKKDAERTLGLLSGKTHLVTTGVCLAWGDNVRVFSETTKVTFRILELAEIKAYVATGEPMDKAGAYASQGGAEKFIENIEGSASNVVGLPLERTRIEIERIENHQVDEPAVVVRKVKTARTKVVKSKP